MSKLKKFMIIESPHSGKKSVWEYIDDVKEANKYWYVQLAIEKYGADNVLPIVMNRRGGYHTHKLNGPDVMGLIESHDWPDLNVWELYPKNRGDFTTGWISPEGDTYSCEVYEHVDCATKLVSQLFNLGTVTIADDFLLNAGWFKSTNKKYTGYQNEMSRQQASLFLDRGFTSNFSWESLGDMT